MPPRSSLRASDADREHVAERLRDAAAEGRLLAEELEHRLERVFRARTYGELDSQVRDLPGRRVAKHRPAIVSAQVIGFAVLAVAAAVVVAVVAALAIAGLVGGWMIWLVAWMFWSRGRHAGRSRGAGRTGRPGGAGGNRSRRRAGARPSAHADPGWGREWARHPLA